MLFMEKTRKELKNNVLRNISDRLLGQEMLKCLAALLMLVTG